MFKKQPKEPSEVQPIIDFIKAHPHEFEISQYIIKHLKTDLRIWIGNAPDHYGFDVPLRDMERNKFSPDAQKVFHGFIQGFIAERLEAERKERVATKIRMLVNH